MSHLTRPLCWRAPTRWCLWTMLCLVSLGAVAEDNLLSNPSFETQPISNQWFVVGGNGTLTASSDLAHSGHYSALLEQRDQAYVGVAQDIKTLLQADLNYTLSAWVRPKLETSQTFSITIKQEDGKGTQYLNIDSLLVRKANWVKLSGLFTLKVTGTLKSLVVSVNGPDKTVDYYVDNFSISPPLKYTKTPAAPTDFIRAKGRLLVVGADEKTFPLLGTNFIAYSDDDEPAETVFNSKNYDQADYKQVAEMGMNVVRLTMFYKVFEDDAKPYQYKKEGWEWLEKNILWARQYGVRLILDMHVPPGGYQLGSSGKFWKSGPVYRDRLISLWQAIAARYKDEPTIAAYDLINEPEPQSNKQWADYAQILVDTIRAVDTNHLIIAEEAFTNDEDSFLSSTYLLKGENIMYDFHTYESTEYANQFIYGRGLGDGGTYPSTTSVFPNSMKASAVVQAASVPSGTHDWQYLESALFTVSDTQVFAATPLFIATDNSGKVYFDDFTIEEFSPTGQKLRTVINAQVERKPFDWYLLESANPLLSYAEAWTGSGQGTRTIEKLGHIGAESLSISQARGRYLLSNKKLTFPVKQNHQYKISGWIKTKNSTGDASLGLQFQEFTGTGQSKPFNRDYLETALLGYGIQFSLDNNVPLNIGEFGISTRSFEDSRGGLTWVNDMLDLMEKYQINAQYFNYHGSAYGIYDNIYGYPDPEYANTALMQLFRSKLRMRTSNAPTASAACESVYFPDGTLSLPCIQVNNSSYSADFFWQTASDSFALDSNSIRNITQTDNCAAVYLLNTGLYLPCTKAQGGLQYYEVFLWHQFPDNVFAVDWASIRPRS